MFATLRATKPAGSVARELRLLRRPGVSCVACSAARIARPFASTSRYARQMSHYRFYELDFADHIKVGYSVECGSDAAAIRAARTLLERSARVEVWNNNKCVAHLGADARPLWPQMREGWISR